MDTGRLASPAGPWSFRLRRQPERNPAPASVSNQTPVAAVRPVTHLPAIVIAPALTWLAASWVEPRFVESWVLVAAAAAAAVLILVPATIWLVDHDRLGLASWLGVGLAGGVTPGVLAILSAALGLWYRGGSGNVRFVFGHGAPIPGLGTFIWPKFLTFVGCSIVVAVLATLGSWVAARRVTPGNAR